MAVADVNGDGLDDVFIGGAKDQPGELLIQQRDGRFAASNEAVFAQDAISEDVGAVFFDANGDGHPDLYVVSGGSEFSEGAPALQDRLYLNDGRGQLPQGGGQLAAGGVSGSRVVAADYDGDGDDRPVRRRARRAVALRHRSAEHAAAERRPRPFHRRHRRSSRRGSRASAWSPTRCGATSTATGGRIWSSSANGCRSRSSGTPAADSSRGSTCRGLEKSNGWWNRIVAGDFTGDGTRRFHRRQPRAQHAPAREPTASRRRCT